MRAPRTFSELEAMTDAELRAAYDEGAGNTIVGVDFVLGELSRRREAAMVRMTRRIAWLTVAIALLTVVNTIGVLVALFE